MTTSAGPSHVYVGAAKWTGGSKSGVFRRGEDDTRWELCNKGLPDDVHVQAITVHPTNPDVVYVGTQDGPYRSQDGGDAAFAYEVRLGPGRRIDAVRRIEDVRRGPPLIAVEELQAVAVDHQAR